MALWKIAAIVLIAGAVIVLYLGAMLVTVFTKLFGGYIKCH
jgi:hypothetical protein